MYAGRIQLRRGVVPLHQLGVQLVLGQHRQLRQPGRRIGGHAGQQHFQIPQQPPYRRPVEQGGLVRALEPQAVAAGLRLDVQVELGRVEARDQVGGDELDACRADRRVGAIGVSQRDLEDRAAARVTFHLQGLDQLGKRQVLMAVGAQRGFLHPRQQLGERRIPRQVSPDRQRVHQEADQRRELGLAAVRADGAHHQVGLAGVAVQQRLQSCHQGNEERGSRPAGHVPEAVQQAEIGHVRDQPAVEILQHRTRPVGGEPHGVEPLHHPAPVRAELGQHAALQPVTLPQRVVSELHRQLREAGRLTARRLPVQRRKLPHEHPDGPAVEHRVMNDNQQQVLIGSQPQQPGPQQRAGRQVERPESLDVDELAQPGLPPVRFEPGQIRQLQRL